MSPAKSCANCRYSVVVVSQSDPAVVATSTTTCHANPPSASTSGGSGNVVWPVVSPNDWCGAYVSGDAFPVASEPVAP